MAASSFALLFLKKDLPVFSGFSSLGSYFFSDQLILGLSGARPASREKDFHFYTAAENLAMAARVPVPKLFVINDSAMNAFATGRDPKHASVCATQGLLDKLDRSELEAVIAHELSHICNYDTLLMSLVAVLVGLVTLLGDWFLRVRPSRNNKKNDGTAIFLLLGLLLALLSPLVAKLIQLAISRNREFLADAYAAKLTRFPDALARALEKISVDPEPLEAANKATAHLYIANPLKNRHDGIGWFASLFNTHPPVAERIARLRQMV